LTVAPGRFKLVKEINKTNHMANLSMKNLVALFEKIDEMYKNNTGRLI